jgi:hypothetical protein
MPVDISMAGLQGQQAYYDRMQTAAQTRVLNSNADATDAENAHAEKLNQLNELAGKRMQDILLRRKGSTGISGEDIAANMDSLAAPIRGVADIYLQGGAIQTATDMLKTASEIEKRESDIDAEQYTTQQKRLDNIVKGADVVSRWIGDAQTEDEWRLGLREIENSIKGGVFTMEPELFDQLKAMPFSPEAAAFFRDRAISASDKARLDLSVIGEERLTRNAAIEQSQAAARISLQAARDAEARRHNAAQEKASGGKYSSSLPPNGDQLRSVKATLLNTIFKGTEVDTKTDLDFNAAVEYVGSQALTMVRGNKAIDWNTAVNRATLQAEQAGMFGKDEGSNPLLRAMGVGSPEKKTFSAAGKTPDTPLPLPKKQQLVKGQFYITAKGIAQWNGSSFESVD